MDSETEVYAIVPRRTRQARKTLLQSHTAPVDPSLSSDYDSPQGHHGGILEPKRASDDSSNRAEVVLNENRRDSKHENHAVLVPIKKGTELGYFSTMSALLDNSVDP